MEEYEYGKFSTEHLINLISGVELFNAKRYWECHEALEHHWLEGRGDNARYVYWAIIQVAACLIHFRDGNLNGAQGLINKAKDKFIKIDELKVYTDLMEKYLTWSKLKVLVNKIPGNSSLEDYQDLFNFEFDDPAMWNLE